MFKFVQALHLVDLLCGRDVRLKRLDFILQPADVILVAIAIAGNHTQRSEAGCGDLRIGD